MWQSYSCLFLTKEIILRCAVFTKGIVLHCVVFYIQFRNSLPHAGFFPCCGRRTASSHRTPPSSILLPGCNDHPSESSFSQICKEKILSEKVTFCILYYYRNVLIKVCYLREMQILIKLHLDFLLYLHQNSEKNVFDINYAR